MKVSIPPICPRCGNKHFGLSMYNKETVRFCTVCALMFNGKGWMDATGEDWVLAESGT